MTPETMVQLRRMDTARQERTYTDGEWAGLKKAADALEEWAGRLEYQGAILGLVDGETHFTEARAARRHASLIRGLVFR